MNGEERKNVSYKQHDRVIEEENEPKSVIAIVPTEDELLFVPSRQYVIEPLISWDLYCFFSC